MSAAGHYLICITYCRIRSKGEGRHASQGRNRYCGGRSHQTINRNVLYLIIGVLAVATAVFGYQLYQERQKTTGIEINIGERGISIEKK